MFSPRGQATPIGEPLLLSEAEAEFWKPIHPQAAANSTALRPACSRLFARLSWTVYLAIMSKVLKDAIQVILVGHSIIVEVEHARLTLIALDANEVLPVHHLVQVAVAVAYGFGVRDRVQLGQKFSKILLLELCELVRR
jgi:hypothetical protein